MSGSPWYGVGVFTIATESEMRPTQDVPMLSWHDAMLLWKQTEREYGVHIDFQTGVTHCDPKRYSITLCWKVKRLNGAKGYTSVYTCTMDYPSRKYRTMPAALVHTLNRIGTVLEEQRQQEQRALAQLPLFSSAD